MISKEAWKKNKADYLKRAGLAKFADCSTVLKALEEKLDTQYATTNSHILDGTNQYISIHGDHQFTLTTPKQEETNETATDLFPQTQFMVVSLLSVGTERNKHNSQKLLDRLNMIGEARSHSWSPLLPSIPIYFVPASLCRR